MITHVAGQSVVGDAVTVQVGALPTTVDVRVVVSHSDAGTPPSAMGAVSDLKLFVDDVQVGATITNLQTGGTCPASNTSCTFDMPWQIAAVGVYDLKATAIAHKTPPGTEATGESEEVEVTIELDIVVDVEFKAAPAIANEYLNDDSGVADACQSEIGGRNWRGQVISAVADWHVEDGVNKKHAFEDANDYDGWVDEVQEFVDDLCDV
jgi:hypothetical protein